VKTLTCIYLHNKAKTDQQGSNLFISLKESLPELSQRYHITAEHHKNNFSKMESLMAAVEATFIVSLGKEENQ